MFCMKLLKHCHRHHCNRISLKMRKCSRAVLLVISTISIVALIFYRHEYNKLRFVLEAFNYFGPPRSVLHGNCSNLLFASEKIDKLERNNYHFDEPIPSWQRINDDSYIYSAFELNDREIRAVAFATAKNVKLFGCKIYYENELQPIAGNFSYKTIGSTSSIDKNNGDATKKVIYNAYHLICIRKNGNVGKTRVAGISFVNKIQPSPDVEILQVKSLEIGANNSNETALCVAPISPRPVLASDMIDFISYHNAIGVGHFVVYDFGVPQRFNSVLKKLAPLFNSTEYSFSYTSVPWNFPIGGVSNDVIRKIVEADCRYRTYKNIGLVATLSWEEFIVMKYHRNLAKLFRDVDDTGLYADRYKIASTNLCTEPEEERANNKGNEIVRGSGTVDQNRPIFLHRSKAHEIFVDDEKLKIREPASDVIVVNRYERHCNRTLNLAPQDDPYVGKFEKNIQNSPIYKLFKIYPR